MKKMANSGIKIEEINKNIIDHDVDDHEDFYISISNYKLDDLVEYRDKENNSLKANSLNYSLSFIF